MQYSLSIGQVGTEIQTVAELLVSFDVSTTMICTHVLKWRRVARRAPLDALAFDP
jgi:site-specific recombinase XerD